MKVHFLPEMLVQELDAVSSDQFRIVSYHQVLDVREDQKVQDQDVDLSTNVVVMSYWLKKDLKLKFVTMKKLLSTHIRELPKEQPRKSLLHVFLVLTNLLPPFLPLVLLHTCLFENLI